MPVANNPPDGWFVGAGAWGTDFDKETTTVYQGAESAVAFLNTTPAADPWIRTEYQPTHPGEVWLADFLVRASSVSAGDTVELGLGFTDKDFNWIADVTIYAAAVLPGAGTWYPLSGSVTAPANAVYAYGYVKKNNTAFYLYVDTMGIKQVPYSFFAYRSSDETRTTGQIIRLDSETYDFGGWFDSGSTYLATIPEDGVYQFVASAKSGTDINVDEYIQLIINSATAMIAMEGVKAYSNDGNAVTSYSIYTGWCQRGDTFGLYWFHNHGSALTVRGGGLYYTCLSGVKIN